MQYLKSLEKLGFNSKEQNVYFTLLQLETATANEIANKSGIKRPTTYDILYRLSSQGFIFETHENDKRKFTARSPEKILEIIDEQKRELKSDLPELLGIFNTKPKKPKVVYFEGTEGVKQLYEDTLSSCKADDEILSYITDDVISYSFYNEDYIKRRVEKGITSRAISVATDAMRRIISRDIERKRVTRLVSKKDFPLKNEINIYANKIIIITHKPEPFGMLIESSEIAATQRAIFEMAWSGIGG